MPSQPNQFFPQKRNGVFRIQAQDSPAFANRGGITVIGCQQEDQIGGERATARMAADEAAESGLLFVNLRAIGGIGLREWVKHSGHGSLRGFRVTEKRPGLFLFHVLQTVRTEQEPAGSVKKELRRETLAAFARVVRWLQRGRFRQVH